MSHLQNVRASTKMQVYKPYKLRAEPTNTTEEKNDPPEELPVENLPPPPPPPGPNMMMAPPVLLPYPPPSMVYLYQMVPFLPSSKANNLPLPLPQPDSPPGPPLSAMPPAPVNAVPVPAPIPVSKTKPRTIHEYYDQHGFQWREFNPEDTVVGDESDPFIVYFRYASKSIGARRTAYLLPKHAKLIRIMQDCLPDFDWRTGEDLLIKAKVLYLRRKSLEEAVEKLKRGESIGPVTKAAMEADDKEEKGDKNITSTEKTEENDVQFQADEIEGNKDEVKKEGTETENIATKEGEEVPKISVESIQESSSSTITVVPQENQALAPSLPPTQRSSESDDTSDTHSTGSLDIPSTPDSTDTSNSTPDAQPDELIEANISDEKTLRESSQITDIQSITVVDKTIAAISQTENPEEIKSDVQVVEKPIEVVPEEHIEVVVPGQVDDVKTMEGWKMLQMVIMWIRNEFAADEEALARQLANKEISYRFLWLYFVPGSLISLEDPVSRQQMAARIEMTDYLPATITGNSSARLEISTKIIDANGDDFIYTNMRAYINDYDAAKLISELPVQLLTSDLPLYQTLKDRGEKFVELNGVHYMTLDGILILNRGRDVLRVRSKTRVMIDCKAFREANPSYNHSFSGLSLADLLHPPGIHSSHHYPRYTIPPLPPPMSTSGAIPGTISASLQPRDIKTVPDEELVLCAPTVFGYAFTEKAWVQMTVDGLSPIVWDVDAYNKLVLPDDTKKLVKSLVQACRTDTKLIKDIISTKGSGVVFVLHGEPGTGKTLTAEAIGEELRRPILVIAVSDLGTDPTNVEIRLGNFLRTAEKWDSIVLLDEADIFLEQRGRQDIFRNAMVGVFLRLLEYHNSPMFLTTNRVFAFDPAIRSRISIAIKYHPLKRVARKQVWQQLLDMANAKISPYDLDEVSMSLVNGREIKNTIRSAQALAVADGTELRMKHIKTVLDVQREFREDFEGLPGLWNGMGVS